MGRFDEGMVDTDVDGYETNLSPTGELPGCPEGFMQVSGLEFHLLKFMLRDNKNSLREIVSGSLHSICLRCLLAHNFMPNWVVVVVGGGWFGGWKIRARTLACHHW